MPAQDMDIPVVQLEKKSENHEKMITNWMQSSKIIFACGVIGYVTIVLHM